MTSTIITTGAGVIIQTTAAAVQEAWNVRKALRRARIESSILVISEPIAQRAQSALDSAAGWSERTEN